MESIAVSTAPLGVQAQVSESDTSMRSVDGSESNNEESELDLQETSVTSASEPEAGDVSQDEEVLLSQRIEDRRKELDHLKQEQAAVEAEEPVAQDVQSHRENERLKFLLQQTDLFTHFCHGSPQRPASKSRKAAPAAATPGRRGRRTEKDEDEEMIQEAMAHDAIRFQSSPPSPPVISGGHMKDYQIHALNWLLVRHDAGINSILADEMGLGKTLESISLLATLNRMRHMTGPHMVVAPKSTLGNWVNEFRKWTPFIRVTKFHGDKEERANIAKNIVGPGKFDVIVTSYEVAIIEKGPLSKHKWKYLIVDEAHRIKNENSILSQVVRMYSSQHRLLLTGTPLQNNLHELWALLNFLLPDIFSSSADFDKWFKIDGSSVDGQKDTISKLHKVLRPFLLRRLKSEVEKELPPKKEVKLFVGMSAMQKQWYRNVLSKDLEVIYGLTKQRLRLLNVVMQLRKVCNHPYLFEGAEPGPPYTTDEHLVTNSGKMCVLDKLLPRLKASGSRVLIFSQMTRLLDILEDYMMFRGHQYFRIDGSTAGTERDRQIEEFNAPGSSAFVFLLSTRAGGLGINLATADTVILYDSDWNPQVDLQAQDRCHRIGQLKKVHVYRFVTDNTVELKIIQRAERKLHLDAVVIQQGRLVEQNKAMKSEELLAMIQFGADEIFRSTDLDKVTDEDLDELLERGKERTKEMGSKVETTAHNLLNFTSNDAEFDYFDWEGVDFRDSRKAIAVKRPWEYMMPKRRERTPAIYSDKVNQKKNPSNKPTFKMPKQPHVHDFQLFSPRLHELLELERSSYMTAMLEQQSQSQSQSPAPAEGDAPAPDVPPKPPVAVGLCAEDKAEKEMLLLQGFASWSRRDYNSFCKACCKYGRNAYAEIAEEMETKTTNEVKTYSAAFWSHLDDIADSERIVRNIERGEQRLNRVRKMVAALEAKIARYSNPDRDLRISYTFCTKMNYTEEEDCFLLWKTHELGYGNWDELKAAAKMERRFAFDWWLKSRSTYELQKRVDQLIRAVEKENQELEEEERKKEEKRKQQEKERLEREKQEREREKERHRAEKERRKQAALLEKRRERDRQRRRKSKAEKEKKEKQLETKRRRSSVGPSPKKQKVINVSSDSESSSDSEAEAPARASKVSKSPLKTPTLARQRKSVGGSSGARKQAQSAGHRRPRTGEASRKRARQTTLVPLVIAGSSDDEAEGASAEGKKKQQQQPSPAKRRKSGSGAAAAEAASPRMTPKKGKKVSSSGESGSEGEGRKGKCKGKEKVTAKSCRNSDLREAMKLSLGSDDSDS